MDVAEQARASEDPGLGKLVKVCVREVWKHEAGDFTPWLSENLDQLTDVLGITLRLEGREVKVGSCRADIVACVPDYGARVIIENQMATTDLKHLGQILAYLAGLEAQIVIWIATNFREDHLSAIRWLNQHTADPYAFFGVKLSAFQIDGSPYAPFFQVLEKPNEWDRILKNISNSIEARVVRRDLWAHCAARWPNPLGISKGYAESRVRRWMEIADLRLTLYLRKDRVRIYVTGNRGEAEKDVFRRIDKYRCKLLSALEGSSFLRGENPRCTTELEIDTHDRNNWDQIADWFNCQHLKYEEVLRSSP